MAGLFIKLDTNFWSHPRIIQCGEPAAVLYQQMAMYCMDHATDGHVPDGQLPRFGLRRTRQRLKSLECAGLIERDGPGWLLPGYLERYRSRAEVEELRRKRADAGRLGGRPRKQVGKANGKQVAFTAHNPEEEEDKEEEGPTSVVTESNRVLSGAASADEATVLWRAAGITRPGPTDGDRKAVAAALRRGWTVAQLTERATAAGASNNPRGYLDAVLAAAPPQPARPPERRPLLDDERTPCEPCGASGWVDVEDGVMPCPACTVGARP